MIEESKIYQAYYTKSRPIVDYMVEMLGLNGDENVLEPCAGDGVFIDSIIKLFPDIKIDVLEMNEGAYTDLLTKYSSFDNISIKKTDTLTDIDLDLISNMGGSYDSIIANPPYGAWRDQDSRKKLKKRYNGFYAKESYTLFLYRCIKLLKESGRLVFIIPDTFLNLHMHKEIRKTILTETKIKEISLFPSSFFPGVDFGYANLSIVVLEKCSNRKACLKNNFKVNKDFKSVNDLYNIDDKSIDKLHLNQKRTYDNSDHSFLTSSNGIVSKCITNSNNTIGNICNCVTGFYSGNDKKYLKVLNQDIRNSKRYETVDLSLVEFNCNPSHINGISGEKEFVPIVKGGNKKYYKHDHWFMKWSIEQVAYYKQNKKARYQNASFYFKKGIGVPMVSSKSITAALIENRLFDQSIVGVFPHDESIINYLLAFFNSPTCNSLIRTINPSANNSANYIKKLPLIFPSDSVLSIIITNIETILLNIRDGQPVDKSLETENNSFIKELYGF